MMDDSNEYSVIWNPVFFSGWPVRFFFFSIEAYNNNNNSSMECNSFICFARDIINIW